MLSPNKHVDLIKIVKWMLLAVFMILVPSQFFEIYVKFPLDLKSRNGLPSSTKVHLDKLSQANIIFPEIDLIRQVFRLLDQHYVDKKRLDPGRMVLAGIRGLKKNANLDIDYIWTDKLDSGSTQLSQYALICLSSTLKTVFCGNQPTGSAKRAIWIKEQGYLLDFESDFDLNKAEQFSKKLVSLIASNLNLKPEIVLHDFFNGILDDLDPHSSYLSEAEYQELRIGTRGQFGGIGLVIEEVQELPVVREMVPNSPAHMAGIRPGDVLVRIGEKVVAFLSLEEVLKEVKTVSMGQSTPVWILRPGTGRFFRVFLSREEIPTRSAESRVVLGRNDVLYLKITGFSAQTAEELLESYEEGMRSAGGKISKVILDLRGNPGGLLDQAIQVADLFLQEGRIVSTKSRVDEQLEYATRGAKITQPVVVLMNSSSASASEIVAGALQDHGRAVVVGERSFGKGSVQSLFELGTGTALKLTVAHYFTPSGNSLQGVGVRPDVDVKLVQWRKGGLWMSGSSELEREESLNSHLDNPDINDLPLKGFKRNEQRIAGTKFPEQKNSIWAYSQEFSTQFLNLEDLNFAYPAIENIESTVDLKIDAVARVGIHVLDSIFKSENDPNMGSNFVEGLKVQIASLTIQAQENIEIIAAQRENQKKYPDLRISDAPVSVPDIGYFFNSKGDTNPVGEGPFTVANGLYTRFSGIQKFIKNAGKVSEVLEGCCTAKSYEFNLNWSYRNSENRDEAKKKEWTSFVGIKANGSEDGSRLWQPVVLNRNSQNWHGELEISAVFRAYLSETFDGTEKNPKLVFSFKSGLLSDEITLGVLPYTALQKPNPAVLKAAALVKNVAVGQGLTTEYSLTIPSPLLSSSGEYELMLVPISDGRIKLKELTVDLKPNLLGDWVAKFHVNLLARLYPTLGQGFGGVIGGIIRRKSGEVVGKLQLGYLTESKLVSLP